MDRETVIQNIMNNYGKYGITQDMVEEGETFCKKACKVSLFPYFGGRPGACQM